MRRSTRIAPFALDLHVLGTPPAFVLSQDQTLQLDSVELNWRQPGFRLRKAWLAVHLGTPARALARTLEVPSEIDCEATAIVFFLGLLFGFQRPSRLHCFTAFAIVADSRRGPLCCRGDSFIRGFGACQLRPSASSSLRFGLR